MIGEESGSSVADPSFLLDANTCIYLIEKTSENLRRNAEKVESGGLATSAICYAEVAIGTNWSNEEAANLVNDFFKVIPVLPFDEMAARRYADLPFRRHRLDQLIAAHALSLNLTLVTANLLDFADVPGLKVEDWTR